MTRADFDWCVVEYNGDTHVAIVDKDCGNRSVTNDAEAVLEEIREVVLNLDELRVVYRDSQGDWDYLVPTYRLGKISSVTFRAGPRGIMAARLEELVAKGKRPT